MNFSRFGIHPVAGAFAPTLSGCFLPPAVSIALYGADGLSYVASGKSMGDHVLSQAAGQDCAVLRVAVDQAVCRSDATPLAKLSVDRRPEPAVLGVSGDAGASVLGMPEEIAVNLRRR
jgi:hypothetical protein